MSARIMPTRCDISGVQTLFLGPGIWQALYTHLLSKGTDEIRVVNMRQSWIALGVLCNTRTNTSLGF